MINDTRIIEQPSADILTQAKHCIDQGDVEHLATLIDEYPELCASRNDDKAPPDFNNSLLLFATSWPGGRPNGAATVNLLIDSGADPMLRLKGDGESVLHWSASNATDAEIAETLIDGGADINAPGGVICGGTPLMNALYFGFTKTAALLVKKGAWIDNLVIAAGLGKTDLLKSWALNNAMFLHDATRVTPQAPFLGEKTLSVESTQTWSYRAVICALRCHQYHVVDWFIERGFDLDLIPPEVDWSCLHHAAYCGSLPMAMYLVCKGADLETLEEHNATAADYAGAHGHPQVMNYLIDQGTKRSLEAATSKGRLDHVIRQYPQCENTARLLKITIGNTTVIGKPVHLSIRQGRVAIAKYLIQKEPGLQRRVCDGQSAVALAQEKDDQNWLSAIREY